MAIYLIVLMCTLNNAATAGSRIVVSLYALDLGANQMIIGVLMALYAVCSLLLSVYIGKLADRVGPRLPMFIGTMGIAIALLLPPLFPGLSTLYILSLLTGMSFNFFFVTVTGITGSVGGTGNRIRNYAILSLGFSGATFMGPMVAGFSIDHLGHMPTFLLLASFTLVPMLLLLFKPEFLPPAVKQEKLGMKRTALDLWRIPTLRNTFIASGFISSGWDLFQFYMPVYGHAVGLSASAIGTVIGIFAFATFVIRVALPYLVKRLSESTILTYAIFVAACSFALFPFFQKASALAGIAFLLGLGLGCGQPMSMSLIYLLSPADRVAESAGLRVTVNSFAHLVIPLAFGSLGNVFGFLPVFISNSVMLVTAGLLVRRNRPSGPSA